MRKNSDNDEEENNKTTKNFNGLKTIKINYSNNGVLNPETKKFKF